MEQVDRLRNDAVVALEALIAKHGYTAAQVDEVVGLAVSAAGIDPGDFAPRTPVAD